MNRNKTKYIPTKREDTHAPELITPAIYDLVIKSQEYKKYCKRHMVANPKLEKEVGMFLIWKSFGCSM